jgi:endonuclease/exonuclease/phosphatase family metal-dependent hydrolase
LRLEEAKVLRGIIDDRLSARPNARLVVLGDFNDVKHSDPIKTIIGQGRFRLVDTRPAERNGDNTPNPVPRFEPRNITWTHYYGVEDTYSRVDYILLSPALAHDWVKKETYVLSMPNWGVASDHRPIVAAFKTDNN